MRTINNLKKSFTIMKAITTRKTTLEMTILCHAIYTYVRYLKKRYNKLLVNLDCLAITLSFMDGLSRPYCHRTLG